MKKIFRAGTFFHLWVGVLLLSGTAIAQPNDGGVGQPFAVLQATLVVDTPQASLEGAGANITFSLTNVSQRPICVFRRLEIAWPGTSSAATLAVTIIGLDGSTYEPAEQIANLTAAPRAEEFIWLAPGKSLSTGPVALLGRRGITKPGRYRITIAYGNGFESWVSDDGVVHEEAEVWTRTVISNPVTIDVFE